ncbi:LutC/YkgG family protein [Vibrio algarum]|uniref:Lactate utilization protein C n=1 Tax=Vibrio algarum TaxID=3020714 RepID=A0ABT4YQ43_9VIBR|nr:lactate utilization protein C [Vibrio sp. KJ40-1]MDB1123683.1 lactate utilization protein C [Vibrio sp. KJ40-1]
MSLHNSQMGSQSARNNILQRLKQAKVQPLDKETQQYLPWGEVDQPNQADKTKRFVAMMTANHAEVMSISRNELQGAIQQVVAKKGCEKAAVGTSGKYHADFIQGIENLEVTQFTNKIEGWKTKLFEQVDVGITHTLNGIADTGALVLWPSIEEPRTLSLVPPCHIAVMDESTILSNFPEVMMKHQWNKSMPTNALLISGPSKTADIQQTLAYGAHGPSELVVLIIKDE